MRFGHRKGRDARITTHVGLVARAFGADKFLLADSDANDPLHSMEAICKQWGGSKEFQVGRTENWRKETTAFKERGGKVIHLTMYGLPLSETVPVIKKLVAEKINLLIFIGAEKVPAELYDLADFNIAVGNQPHSEVAALAVFLDRVFDGQKIEKNPMFSDAKISIIPTAHGKETIEK